jgi:D-alanyl-lipoteichoic acid acyltransferase DltB (MBOAT superfamily)
MPIGISFYVFKTLSYVIDMYREVIEEPEKNYFNYLLYVSFFPNVMAGPISRARDLLPQIKAAVIIDNEKISRGFYLILIGAFKKIVIADYLAANFVDRVFESSRFFTGFENLMASYGAIMQFYCDFSGYTDIVIGIALLLGFTIEANFNEPLKSISLSDFWRRWHITLLKWLTEYVYMPIAFSMRKIGKAGVMIGILLTFLISGIWHGANITFIIWGLMHGIVLSFELLTQKVREKLSKLITKRVFNFIGGLITFHFLTFSIILFKSDDVPSALAMYKRIITDFNPSLFGQWISIYTMPFIILVFGYVLHFLPSKWKQGLSLKFTKLHWSVKTIVVFVGILLIYQAFNSETQPFIYLEF